MPESDPDQGGLRPLLVLGSASPARATLLRNAGVTPVIRASGVDEDAVCAELAEQHPDLATDPDRLTQWLARAKALDVAEQVRAELATGAWPLPGRRVIVIGADSMLDFAGQVLGKARTPEEVRTRWAAMSGAAGVLVTGHTVVDVASGRTAEATVATTIRFGRPDPVELAAYIASGEPLAVAGSCTIDGLGGPFIDGIDGDHTNVIGLALPTLRGLLGQLGIRWTDLWQLA